MDKDHFIQDKINKLLDRASKRNGIGITMSNDIRKTTSSYGTVSVGNCKTVRDLIERDLDEIKPKLIADGMPEDMVEAAFDEVRKLNGILGKLNARLDIVKQLFGL